MAGRVIVTAAAVALGAAACAERARADRAADAMLFRACAAYAEREGDANRAGLFRTAADAIGGGDGTASVRVTGTVCSGLAPTALVYVGDRLNRPDRGD